MHCQQVQRVFGENCQQFRKRFGRLEPEARLDRKHGCDRIAQSAQDGIHALRLTQQAAAGAFAIDHGRRTAQIQVHRGNGILLQLPRCADQRRNIVANHLGHNRLACGILSDGPEDVLVERRSGVNAEILGKINIRTAVS